jgi:hypothetical protein
MNYEWREASNRALRHSISPAVSRPTTIAIITA